MSLLRICLVASALLISACVTQDIKLSRKEVTVASERAVLGGLSCSLPEFELVDTRKYPGLGWIGGHELLYPELETWVNASLRNATQLDASKPALQIEISRAYKESHPSGHSFQLVLRARADENDNWRVYRGSESGITWWGSSGEFGRYVEDAGKRAIAALSMGEGRCAKD